jgi:hypothetical protein
MNGNTVQAALKSLNDFLEYLKVYHSNYGDNYKTSVNLFLIDQKL